MTESKDGDGSLSRRSVVGGAAAAALASAVPSAVKGQVSSRPPNIIFILADDLGYADLSCYGRRDYETSNIDGLAADGLLLTHGYSNSAVCSPTRVALITGRYHQRLPVGLPEPIEGTEQGIGLPTDLPTLPGVLKTAGYRTSLVGKWHMGWPPEKGPLASGYDAFFGIAPGAADHFTHTFGRVRENVLYEGGAKVERDGYLTELLAERAVEDIRQSVRSKQPFFLSLHFTAPHWPWQGPDDRGSSPGITHLRHEDGGSLKTYAQMMLSMDDAVGHVLRELKQGGLSENTIVVFTSDNGGERFSDMWPHRGSKGELLEGGIRVPLIVKWPARIRGGLRSEQVMTSMDWQPTLAGAARAPLDRGFPPDGMNLVDVLTNRAPIQPRKLFWRHRKGNQAAVRDGDWKYLRMGEEEFLYNVMQDPRERTNLREREGARFKRLQSEYAAWNATMLPYPASPAAR